MSIQSNKVPLGIIFRQKREEKGLLVRQVAAVIEVDQALISRIENCDRLPTKEQVLKLAGLYGLDLKETYSAWLAERMVRDYGDEPYASDALKEAHNHILMHSLSNEELPANLSTLNKEYILYSKIQKPESTARKSKDPDPGT